MSYHIGQRRIPFFVEDETAVECGDDVGSFDVTVERRHEVVIVGVDEQVSNRRFWPMFRQRRTHANKVAFAGICAAARKNKDEYKVLFVYNLHFPFLPCYLNFDHS